VGENANLQTSMPAWFTQKTKLLFQRFATETPSKTYPEDYQKCHGTEFIDTGNNTYKWSMDLLQYLYDPAMVFFNGFLGYASNFTDNKNVLAVTSVEVKGNYDTEKGCAGEREFGDI